MDRQSELCIIIMPLHNRVIRNNITILVYDKLKTELDVTLVALVVKIIIALML